LGRGFFIITGFSGKEKQKEAAGTIQTVIAQYGYTPEFSTVRKQMGAVIASLPMQTSKGLPPNHPAAGLAAPPAAHPRGILPLLPDPAGQSREKQPN
jgi:hypothetical protein